MSLDLEFSEAGPEAAAAQMDAESIHLWRIPYVRSQRRAPLSELLGAYLRKPASQVVLDQNANGKPQLADTDTYRAGKPRLEFNWSHSGDYALVALSRGLPLGVDIERLNKNLRAIEIARRFFDPAETGALTSLAPHARDHAFIGLWCAKEAVLKAAGEGLSFGLARLAFKWRSGMDWDLERVDPALGDNDDWRLHVFDATAGYRGALAWRGPDRRIVAFRPLEPDRT